MSIHDFSEALHQPGSRIQMAYSGMQDPRVTEQMDPADPNGALAWNNWI